MNPRLPSEGFDASPAPAKELEPLLERYLGDHTALRELLVQVEALAYLTTGCAEPEFERRLYELSTAVTGLAKALEAHSAWEDEAFFPMLSRCLDIPNQPTLATTLWMLEKEHALTFAFFRSFFEQAAAGGGQRSFVARGGAKDQLILACRLVRGHLSMEEAAIVPLTEPFCGSICDCFHIHDNGLEVY